MKLSGETIKAIRADLNQAVEAINKKYNVAIRAGNASYDPTGGTATIKLDVVALGDGGAQRDIPAELFIQFAPRIGLKPDDLGKVVTIQGRKFKVAGYKPKATKNNIIIKSIDDGKVYVTDTATVKRQLAK